MNSIIGKQKRGGSLGSTRQNLHPVPKTDGVRKDLRPRCSARNGKATFRIYGMVFDYPAWVNAHLLIFKYRDQMLS